jgi:hypothetical protein
MAAYEVPDKIRRRRVGDPGRCKNSAVRRRSAESATCDCFLNLVQPLDTVALCSTKSVLQFGFVLVWVPRGDWSHGEMHAFCRLLRTTDAGVGRCAARSRSISRARGVSGFLGVVVRPL